MKAKRIKRYLPHMITGIFLSREKKQILEQAGWYKNLTGGYAHPHAIDYMTRKELLACTPDVLRYKMRHGSMSEPPRTK